MFPPRAELVSVPLGGKRHPIGEGKRVKGRKPLPKIVGSRLGGHRIVCLRTPNECGRRFAGDTETQNMASKSGTYREDRILNGTHLRRAFTSPRVPFERYARGVGEIKYAYWRETWNVRDAPRPTGHAVDIAYGKPSINERVQHCVNCEPKSFAVESAADGRQTNSSDCRGPIPWLHDLTRGRRIAPELRLVPARAKWTLFVTKGSGNIGDLEVWKFETTAEAPPPARPAIPSAAKHVSEFSKCDAPNAFIQYFCFATGGKSSN